MSNNNNNKPSNLKAPSKLTKPNPTTTTTGNVGGPVAKPAGAGAIPRLYSSSSNLVLTENTDDFIVGNRVWVGGTKPGYIQYIGETQFAPGEWAGVVLEEPIGKNDGSVNGIRYFQCEPKRGVFSRLTKLTREPVLHLIQAEGQDLPSDDGSSVRANGSVRSVSPRPGSASRLLSRSSTPSSLHGGSDAVRNLKLGERIQVTSASGTKNGILRYLGTTEFAVGEWVGVELDDASGKNDGSVNGKRYFSCPMKYGLFAPVHKVSKATASSSSVRRATPASPLKRIGATPKRTGSQDSVNTIGSAASSVRSTKPRLGITSLTSSVSPSRSSATNITATHTAMQGALKEKEQHVEQLMKERDMERAELVRAAAQVEEAERQLASLKTEYEKHKEDSEKTNAKLREVSEVSDKRLRETKLQLEEERKKVEDLQFRIEEESINKSDLEQTAKISQSSREVDVERIRELEHLLQSERTRSEELEKQNNLTFQNDEELLAKHLAEIEGFKEKLQRAEDTTRLLEAGKVSEISKTSQVAEQLVKRDNRISELERTILDFKKLQSETTNRIETLSETVAKKENDISNRESIISELNSKVTTLEANISKSTKLAEEMQIINSDLQRRLKGTEERVEEMAQHKAKLESQIDDHMRSSGDNSAQLVAINDRLRDKERTIEELRLELQNQKQETKRTEDVQEQQESRHRREIEALGTKHWEEVTLLEEKLKESQGDAQTIKGKYKSREDESARTLEALAKKHEQDVGKLRGEAEERCAQMEELVLQLEVERKSGDDRKKNLAELHGSFNKELSQKQSELELALKAKAEAIASCKEIESNLMKQIAELSAEKTTHTLAVSERDKRLADLNNEVDRIKAEFESHRIDLQSKLAETALDQDVVQNMRNHHELQQKHLEEVQERLIEVQEENARLLKEIASGKVTSATSKTEFESKISKLEEQLEAIRIGEVQSRENYENEKETLQRMLETTQMLFEQKEKDLVKQQTELATLKKDASSNNVQLKVELQKLRDANGQLEREKTALDTKIVQLQADLSRVSTETAVESADATLQNLIEEKEMAEGQVDFLNSVIVDMQKKNDELNARIEVLEIGDLITDSSDVNLNEISASAVPPRLFCDICDVFDLHDTEDCPKQETPEVPAPTQYHGSRNQERPYCDICEVFGHWTNECDSNETF